jgi:cob(I)alamin adenosyltransferase
MTRFYTRSGDQGYTGLLGEGRVPKYHARLEAVGNIDEASATLGFARSLCKQEVNAMLIAVQRDLYLIMGEIASLPENAARFRAMDANRVAWLEEQVDRLSSQVTLPKEFIVPGDTTAGAAFAMARTVVRRAERCTAILAHQGEIENPDLLRYLNRLSSLCFILELVENQSTGKETPTQVKE